MKKYVFVSVLFVCTLFFLVGPASALPGGLLDGKPLTIRWKGGSDVDTKKLTDNDPSTGEMINWNGQVIVDFGDRSVDIDRWYLDGGINMGGTLQVYFYRMGQVLLWKSVGGAQFYDTPLKGVDKIVISYSGGFNGVIREFDIFGDIDVPYPSGVSAEPGTRQIKVNWNRLDIDDLSGYIVYLNGVPGPLIADTSYIIKNLTPDRRYKIEVVAMYGDVASKRSEAVEATPFNDPLPDPKIEAKAWHNRLNLHWNDNGASIYRLYHGMNKLYEGQGLAYTHSGLRMDTEYTYRLEHIDKYGRSKTMEKTFRTAAEVVDDTPPAVPAGLAARMSDDALAILLSWQPSPDDLKEYIISMSPDGGKTFRELARTEDATYQLKKFEPKKEYQFRVAAEDEAGNVSDWSNVAKITTPTRDTESEVTPGDGFLLLRWKAVPGAVGYEIIYNGKQIDKVGAAVREYKITPEKGYKPESPFQDAKAIPIFADGSKGSGGSGGAGGGADPGFGAKDVFQAAIFIVGSLSSFILLWCVMQFAPQIVSTIKRALNYIRREWT